MTRAETWLFLKHQITDQNVTGAPKCVHAQLTPLIYEECIFQPLIDHAVYFLQPEGKETEQYDATKKDIRAMTKRDVLRNQHTLNLHDFTTLETFFPTLQANAPAPTNLELFRVAFHSRTVPD